MERIVAVIPVRMASSRFPGKPLAALHGLPMVEHVFREPELLPLVPTIHGAICGDDEYTERVLHAAPHLKVISKWGTGIDSIDTNAAAGLGIRVFNTPNAFTDCVADSTLGYILNFARQLYRMDHDVRNGKWIKPEQGRRAWQYHA
jgi:D-3-phosphoglycerate dehydrogenase / 2-oxoglutarate reductase